MWYPSASFPQAKKLKLDSEGMNQYNNRHIGQAYNIYTEGKSESFSCKMKNRSRHMAQW